MDSNTFDLPNFHVVLDRNNKSEAPWLFRGGQPSDQGFDLLKSKYNVETVICLRRDHTRWEEHYLMNLGIKFIYLPLPLALPKLSPEDFHQRMSLFLQSLKDAQKNVYVHCVEGRDRTGLMIALYRTCAQSWPIDDAYSEMVSCGYRGFVHHVILSAFKDKLYELGEAC